jgi:hypothetical protein
MEMSSQLNAPAPLPPGKSLWYPLDRRLGGPKSQSERGIEQKNSQLMLRYITHLTSYFLCILIN